MRTEETATQLSQEDRSELDGSRLIASLNIDEQELAFRKSFTRFNRADAERLGELQPMFENVSGELSEEFYSHIQAHDEAEQFLDRSSRDISQLKTLQSNYLQELGRGEYDVQYFEQRARIGKIHDMLGLGPKIFFGGYAVYYEKLLDHIASEAVDEALNSHRGDLHDGTSNDTLDAAVRDVATTIRNQMLSTLKLMLLDQQLAMDTYIESYSQIEAELAEKTEIAEGIQTSVNQLKAGVEVVTGSAEDIGDIANEQLDSMQEVANEASNLGASIEEVASTANQVDERSTEAERLADEGQSSADDAQQAMAEVSETTADMANKVNSLHENIQDIDEVVDVIDDIADQTNMLALNASIEAARAEQSGDGFAVVADEVKTLANQSKENAEEIATLIESVQVETETVVEQLETTNQAVSEGQEKMDATVETLRNIAEAVRETSHGIQEVADATEDQATSTEEVASMVDRTVEDMDTIAGKIEDIVTVINEQSHKTDQIDQSVSDLAETAAE